nr:MAG TPA: hypothetical protein [Caudoviricetes sp.]
MVYIRKYPIFATCSIWKRGQRCKKRPRIKNFKD